MTDEIRLLNELDRLGITYIPHSTGYHGIFIRPPNNPRGWGKPDAFDELSISFDGKGNFLFLSETEED